VNQLERHPESLKPHHQPTILELKRKTAEALDKAEELKEILMMKFKMDQETAATKVQQARHDSPPLHVNNLF
jgi:hypothetical protein